MKNVILVLLLLPFLGLAQEQESRLLQTYELKIKMNEGRQFREGMQKWKECYLQNNGTDTWNVWNRVQGESGTVVVSFFLDKWAELDKDATEADKACQELFYSDIFPHVESMRQRLANTMPELSSSAKADTRVIWVTFFDVSNSTDFQEVIKEVSSVYAESNGEPLGAWYDFNGGAPGDADYMVSMSFKNYGELDAPWDGPWKVYENKHGKEKMNSIRNKFRASLKDSWSYMYELNEELSNFAD